MDVRNIRKDKELARVALKGLTVYGEQIAGRERRMRYSRLGGLSMK